MGKIIPFKNCPSPLPLTATRLKNVKDEDDVLADRKIHMMMQHYYASGVYRSMLSHDVVEPRGRISDTYAEQILTEDYLVAYAIKSPTRGIRAPMWHEDQNTGLFNFVEQNRNASRIYTIAACSWFYGCDISKGLLSMLMGNQSDRMVNQIDDLVEMLTQYGGLNKTTEIMTQPVQPYGVSFSKSENIIYRPCRRTLYRDIEKVMFLSDALAGMNDIYNDTMVKWTSKAWPSLRKPTTNIVLRKQG